jgi:hypothetical protein
VRLRRIARTEVEALAYRLDALYGEAAEALASLYASRAAGRGNWVETVRWLWVSWAIADARRGTAEANAGKSGADEARAAR